MTSAQTVEQRWSLIMYGKEEKIKWLTNLRTDIGKSEHQELWHYEQALTEIIEDMTEPVKHGEWVEDGAIVKCDKCGEHKQFPHWKFCPNCGANMGE